MFGRKKNKTIEDNDMPFVQGDSPESVPAEAPMPVEKVKKTVIGKHIFIEGNIRGAEHLLIEGSMKGMVDMPKYTFYLGVNGHFEGGIHALNVNISGKMEGEIKSLERVVITKDANFQGDIKTKTILLEDGAYFKGSIELDKDKQKKIDKANKTPVGEQQNKTAVADNRSDGEQQGKTNTAGKTSEKVRQDKANAAEKTIEIPLQQLGPNQKSKPIVETKKLNKSRRRN